MKKRRPNSTIFGAKKKTSKAPPMDAFDFLGKLFGTMYEASRKYPPIERSRATDIFSSADNMWKKVMMLCHPDKHQNSDLSHEVTRWLIANRPGGKRD